jgi:hypothetical protein
VRLCDVLLESPAVGLLGLCIFKLPAVGLPEFNHTLTRKNESGVCEEGLREEKKCQK